MLQVCNEFVHYSEIIGFAEIRELLADMQAKPILWQLFFISVAIWEKPKFYLIISVNLSAFFFFLNLEDATRD